MCILNLQTLVKFRSTTSSAQVLLLWLLYPVRLYGVKWLAEHPTAKQFSSEFFLLAWLTTKAKELTLLCYLTYICQKTWMYSILRTICLKIFISSSICNWKINELTASYIFLGIYSINVHFCQTTKLLRYGSYQMTEN